MSIPFDEGIVDSGEDNKGIRSDYILGANDSARKERIHLRIFNTELWGTNSNYSKSIQDYVTFLREGLLVNTMSHKNYIALLLTMKIDFRSSLVRIQGPSSRTGIVPTPTPTVCAIYTAWLISSGE